jgi:molybdopterin-guanine dinucleotide biosynthesis protein A
MGTDKALVEFDGRPLIVHALAVLRDAGLPVLIAGARSPLSSYAPVVPDSQADRGPLAGICAALASFESEPKPPLTPPAPNPHVAVFVSVDLPLLPPSLLLYMLHHSRITGTAVTLPSVNGFVQTFPVVLTVDSRSVLDAELSRGQRGCYAAFEAAAAARGESLSVLPVEVLAQSGKVIHRARLHPARWFLNVNTPLDLRRLRSARVS